MEFENYKVEKKKKKKKGLLARLCIKHTSASLCICLCVTLMLQPDTAEVVWLFILAWPVVSDVKSVFVSLYGPWMLKLLVFVERGQKQPQRSVGYLQPKTFRRGSRQAVCPQGNVQPLMWPLGKPAPATLKHCMMTHCNSDLKP